MHVLVLGDPSRFLQGQKAAILGKIFNKVLKWWLTIAQLGGIWKLKTIDFITD